MMVTKTLTFEVPEEVHVAVLSAGTSHPSTTLKLATEIETELETVFAEHDLHVIPAVIDIPTYAGDLATAVTGGYVEPRLQTELDRVRDADVVVVATPVYKAGVSGLFKMFIDVLDDDAVLGTPVILAATAGTPRHALVIDGQLRSLFAYLRAMVIPTSVFAATEDWERPRTLKRRVQRAVLESFVLFESRVRETMRAGDGYKRTVTNTDDDIQIDADLLSAITGGSLPPR